MKAKDQAGRVGSIELLGGIDYWADLNHWAVWGEPYQSFMTGPEGEAFRAEDGSEGPRVAAQLALEVLGNRLGIGDSAGRALEPPATQPNTDPWVREDVAIPIRYGAACGGEIDCVA